MKRYFIKAYPMHETEITACQQAAIEDAEYGDGDEAGVGMVQGIADEATIEKLSQAGIIVQAISEVPGGGQTAAEVVALPQNDEEGLGFDQPTTVGVRPAGRGPAATLQDEAQAAREPYFLVNLLGGISDRTMASLEAAGAEIVERDPSGLFLVHAAGGAAAAPFLL